MTLEEIWNEYKENPTDEKNTELLCSRIKKFAGIVLSRFRFNNPCLSYEDLMQSAYICFFDMIETYDPKKSKLENHFMAVFRRRVIDQLRELKYNKQYYDSEDIEMNPLDILIWNEWNDEIEEVIAKVTTVEDPLYLYRTYLIEGIFDYAKIAKEEGEKVDDVKYAIAEIQEAVRRYLEEEYQFWEGR